MIYLILWLQFKTCPLLVASSEKEADKGFALFYFELKKSNDTLLAGCSVNLILMLLFPVGSIAEDQKLICNNK